MRALELTPAASATRSDSDHDDDLVHTCCCRDENLAQCGAELDGALDADPGESADDCLVCEDLNALNDCTSCPKIRGAL